MKYFNMFTDVLGAAVIILCLMWAVSQMLDGIAETKCQIELQTCVDESGHFEKECP